MTDTIRVTIVVRVGEGSRGEEVEEERGRQIG